MKKLLLLFITILLSTEMMDGRTMVLSNSPDDDDKVVNKFMNSLELHAAVGLVETNESFAKQYFGIANVFGYSLTKRLDSGIGVGILFYGDGPLMPLYLDFRYNVRIKRLSIFPFGDTGFLFSLNESTTVNRFFVNPGAGIKHYFSNNMCANFGIGLFTQWETTHLHDSFVNFKIGFMYQFRSKKTNQ